MESVKVHVEVPKDTRIEDLVDQDITEFQEYFMSLGNDHLSGYEKAAIKTYLHWKIYGK